MPDAWDGLPEPTWQREGVAQAELFNRGSDDDV